MAENIAGVASAIGASLLEPGGPAGEAEARRLAFSFVETIDGASSEEVEALVAAPPATTGDHRFDALVAAVVEHACTKRSMPSPAWVNEPHRFLSTWWFMSEMPSLHADAIVHSPISFARRGVFITSGALTYA
ncbi:MAG TPA: hypothetical protein VFP61_07330 [Acidimicrobiales bacterium]|nr:hypothetical protein [Acidimicrobiales bacterium]